MPRIGSLHTDEMQAKTLYALSALLILVQIPHLPHLPAWINGAGLLLVGGRLFLLKNPTYKLLQAVLSPLSVTLIAVGSAFLINWHYGYFIGRDPCVAFLFILVAAKFAEVQRAKDATILLCLCAFLLLTQYFYSQSIISAALTLPAVIALAYSLSVLRDTGNPESTFRQIKMVSVLLVQGLPLAALLFFVFPRLPGPMWSLPEDAMATTGLSDSMSPGSIGQLSQSGAVAFRVEFDDVVPDAHNLYWRGPVLTQFDGRNWTVSTHKFNAVPQYNGGADSLVNYTVTLQPHHQRWLFALDTAASQPESYNAAGNTDTRYSRSIGYLYEDGQILTKDAVSQTLRYQQSSMLSSSLPATGQPRPDTLFLPNRNLRTIEFAKQLRSSHQSDSGYADSILLHFNEKPFSYTLRPQVLGHAPIDEFLFDSREGFCEHYAAAFVVMMRAVGIPSRVVTGYQGGEMNKEYMIVRQSDAHAWAEVYLNGAWQRYDPTTAVAPSRVASGLAAALPNESSVPELAKKAPGLLRDIQLRWDAINHGWQRLVIDFDNDSQAGLWERVGFNKPALWQIGLIVLALAGLWSLLVLKMPRRGNLDISAPEHSWNNLVALLESQLASRRHNESAEEYLQRAALQWPKHQSRFQRLQAHFARLRFQPFDNDENKSLLKQVKKDILFLQMVLPLDRRSTALLKS